MKPGSVIVSKSALQIVNDFLKVANKRPWYLYRSLIIVGVSPALIKNLKYSYMK